MTEWLELSPWLLAALAATVFVGAAFQNLFGIGFGLIASPLIFVIDHRLVPSVVIMIGTLSAIPHAVANVRRLNWRHCATATVSRLVGSAAGAAVLARLLGGTDSRAFALVFAATLVFAVLMSTVGRWAKFFTPSVPKLAAASMLSGLFGTMTSIGGPPVALIYRLQPPALARAHLNAFIAIGGILSVAALYAEGLVGILQLKAAALLAAPAALGMWSSRLFADAAHRHFKGAILGVVLLSAVAIAARALG